MEVLPESWATLPLGDAVTNVAITDKKIPQKAYLSEGAYPVIDQGQDYIGGYTDEKEKLVDCELPVIIFGDHTRVVKFVNQAFAPGADGVKVLQPQCFYVPRLLEYFTRHIATHLTSHGYARHYQHLVKSTIPLPPLNEQHRIVAKIEELFSELDKGIENLKTAREQLKVYRQALLKHAFEGKLTAQWREERRAKNSVAPAKAGAQPLNGMDSRLRGNDEPLETAAALLARIQTEREQRYQQQLQQWQTTGASKPKAPKPLPPLTADELAELPEGWITLCVENLFEIEDGDRGEHYPTKGDFSDSGYCLFLNAKNVTKRGFTFQETSFISEKKHLALRKGTLKRGDIVFTSRGTLGNIAHYNDSIQYEHVRINSGMFIIRNYDDFLTPDFLYYHLNAPIITGQIEKLQSGTAQPQLPIREFKSFRFVIPSKEEQQQIVQELESKLSEVDQLDQTLTASLQQAEALRQSILKRAFSGQLVPQDPNDESAAALLARIQAERASAGKTPAVRRGREKV